MTGDEELDKRLLHNRIAGEQIKKLSQIYVAKAFDMNKDKSHEAVVRIGMALVLGGMSVLKEYTHRPGIEGWVNHLIGEIWGKLH